MPWDHLDCGISKSFLVSEYKKAFNKIKTPDCRSSICNNCGACDSVFKGMSPQIIKDNSPDALETVSACKRQRAESRKDSGCVDEHLRVKFSKTGDARFISHLDLVDTFVFALRRLGIPLIYSHGFHPRPRISFGPALSVGIESDGEYFDIVLSEGVDLESFLVNLNEQLPLGIFIKSVEKIPAGTPALSANIGSADYEISSKDSKMTHHELSEIVRDFLQQTEIIVTRNKKDYSKEINIRAHIESITAINGCCLNSVLKIQLNPNILIKELFKSHEAFMENISIRRTELFFMEKTSFSQGVTEK